MDGGSEKGGDVFNPWREWNGGGAQNAATTNFYARLLAGPNYRYQAAGDETRTCADATGNSNRTPQFLQSRQSAFVAPAVSNSGSINEYSGLGFPLNFPLHLAAPQVTVVLEGRSICQRICLDHHANYETFAIALRKMFADIVVISSPDDSSINLANAVPGYVIAYEDIEGDLLLAGDLSWKDFVRVAKRIRILPAKNPPKKSH